MSDGSAFPGGATLGRRLDGSDRRGSGLTDVFLVGFDENARGAATARGRRVGVFESWRRGRSKAVRPGPPTPTRPGGGSFTSSTPKRMTPPGASFAARCFVASWMAAG